MMIMRLGVIKPLETRKFIVVSRQYLGSSEAEVIELWKNVMVSGAGGGGGGGVLGARCCRFWLVSASCAHPRACPIHTRFLARAEVD